MEKAQAKPGPGTEAKPVSKSEEKKTAALLKQIDEAFFAFRFYPVAVKEDAKQEAVEKIRQMYAQGDATVKQLILYQFHEHLSKAEELKIMHNFEFFKRQQPTADPSQLRIQVYRAMFNYHYSIEGLVELVQLLAQLEGDDAAKLLTYHLSFLAVIETEGTHMLRNAIVEALGHSPSLYALRSLLRYARLVDQEQFLHRILMALAHWDRRLDDLRIPAAEKKKLREELSHMLTTEFGDTHYG